MVGQVERGLRSLQSAGLRTFCKECCVLFPTAAAAAADVGEMSWNEGPGEVQGTLRDGREQWPFPRRAEGSRRVSKLTGSQEELEGGARGRGWKPQGGVCGVSSGQAFRPHVPQFSPSC